MDAEPLKKLTKWQGRRGPLVLVIMDGMGYNKNTEGNAFANAVTCTLDELVRDYPHTLLKAHGFAVGLPSDSDQGNSEVGHNALGCGRVFAQGAKIIADSLASGRIFETPTWKRLIENAKKGGTLHFIGLLSDGCQHGDMRHMEAMLNQAHKEGVKRIRIHAILDGRDVGETSALEYFDPFEERLKALAAEGCDAKIASGGGRMRITMDRYNGNWPMVEKGWHIHVLGEGRQFASSHEAIVTLREETGANDQNLDPFVIAENGKPVGPIVDGDSVILYNFRGDRAIQLTRAFEEENFDCFDRVRWPKVEFAGMMEYDSDLHVPKNFLVSPPEIDRTIAEYLCKTGVKQFSISETQKFGHITYFFNGNRTNKFDENLEEYVNIPGDLQPFDQRPAMKCADITDKVIEVIEGGEYQFIKLNYPNGDMVGHTGVYQAVVCGIEAMDLSIKRLKEAVKKAGGILIVTADHGNAEEMFDRNKDGSFKLKENGQPKAKTSHTTNPVLFMLYDPEYKGEYEKELKTGLGITSVTGTCMNLLGYEAPADYDPSIITFKK